MGKLLGFLRGLFTGDRRRRMRIDPERVNVTNRLANAEIRLARHVGTTPEELFDYRRADHILGRRR